jgi:hypothetical protein
LFEGSNETKIKKETVKINKFSFWKKIEPWIGIQKSFKMNAHPKPCLL